MARKNDDESDEVLFPELDDSAEHKAILASAKRLAKKRANRKEQLSTAKEQEDTEEAKLVELMHAAKIPKFKHGMVKVELAQRREKAVVKIGGDEEDGEDESGDE